MAGLEISDRVRVTIWAGDELADAARQHERWIADEVLAEEWEVAHGDPPGAGVAQLDVDGFPASVRLEKVDKSG